MENGACVIHEGVDARLGCRDLGAHPFHFGEPRKIRIEDAMLDPRTGLAKLRDRGFAPTLISCSENNPGAL